jgi:predicted acyl esterase
MQGSFLVAGQPQVRMQASTAAPRVQLDVRLFDDKSTGESVLLTRGTYTLDAGALPIGTTDVRIPTYGNLLQVDATDTLRLEITNVDSPYIMPSRVPSVTQISGVHLDLPLRPAP